MRSKLLRTLFEINEASFKYYISIYMALLFLDLGWEGGFVLKFLRFPLRYFLWFLIFSAAVRLYLNFDKAIYWLHENSPRKVRQRLNFNTLARLIKKRVREAPAHVSYFFLILYLTLITVKDVGGNSSFKILKWFSSFNPSRFFWLAILSGVVYILFGDAKMKRNKQVGVIKKHLLIIGTGILGGILIFLKVRGEIPGWIPLFISLLGGFLIILLSFIILEETNE